MTTLRHLCFPDPVSDRADLYGRDAALADVLASLRHRTTVIQGGRFMGKTSLLNVVAQLVEEQGQFAMIRLAPTDSRAAFIAEILDGIHQWVDEHHRDPSFTHVAEQHAGSVAQFCKRIETLAGRVTGVVFLLCVDELDSLVQNLDEHEARLVLELIEHLDTMPRLPVRFLLTMSTIPDLVLTSFRSTFLNKSEIVTLEPWDADEAGRFIEWLVDDRFIFDEEALAALFTAAGGHPYFTKAVLVTLLTGQPYTPGSRYISAERIAVAVRQAVRSRTVDLALTNFVSAHLSADATAVLDRAGNSPTGVTGRGLSDLPSARLVLNSLQADGLLRWQDHRYLLRLGLWREWRAATPTIPSRPPLLRRIVRAAKRIQLRRPKTYILICTVAGPFLIVLLTTALLTQTRTFFIRPCGTPNSKLGIYATYPEFASAGDRQQIQITVVNNGRTGIAGSAILSFSARQAHMYSANGIPFDVLPGEQATLDTDFTTTASAGSHLTAEVAVSVGRAVCRDKRWSINVALIPRLQLIQKVSGALLVLFLIPLVVELAARYFEHERHGSHAGPAEDS